VAEGFVLVHRRLADDRDPFWNPERKWCWLDIVMRAAYRDRRVSGIALRRGQVLLSLTVLEQDWGWSRDKVRYFIKQLIDRGSMQGNRRTDAGTVYDLPSYDKYQSPEKKATVEVVEGGQLVRTGSEHPSTTGGATPQHHSNGGVEVVQAELLERPTNGPLTTPLVPPMAPPLQRSKEDTATATDVQFTTMNELKDPSTWPPNWRSQLEFVWTKFWLEDQFPDGVYPPNTEVGKQRKFVRRMCEMCQSPLQGLRAMMGVRNVWPWKPPRSEPWTPQRQLARFSECQAAAVNHDEIKHAAEMAAWVRGE